MVRFHFCATTHLKQISQSGREGRRLIYNQIPRTEYGRALWRERGSYHIAPYKLDDDRPSLRRYALVDPRPKNQPVVPKLATLSIPCMRCVYYAAAAVDGKVFFSGRHFFYRKWRGCYYCCACSSTTSNCSDCGERPTANVHRLSVFLADRGCVCACWERQLLPRQSSSRAHSSAPTRTPSSTFDTQQQLLLDIVIAVDLVWPSKQGQKPCRP